MWTINQALESSARKFGGRTAVVDGDRQLSFEQLEGAVVAAAAWLQEQGIGKGDKVAIQGRNTSTWIVNYYAILRAGAVAVPLNHKLAPAETRYILDHSESRLLLVDDDIHDEQASPDDALPVFGMSAGGALPPAPPRAAARQAFQPVEVADTDLAELLYTSGTTGKPKGCMHSHANALLAGIGSSLVYGLGPEDRVLLAMPIWHSFPLNNMLVAGHYLGACVVLLPEYHPLHFVETVQKERCTLFFGAPVAYSMPLQMLPNFDEYDLSSVRAWLYGGGPIDAAMARELMKRYGTDRFYQVFGMTETGPTGTALLPEEQVAKAGSIGRWAVSGCDVTVMKDDSTPAARGEVGEIWMRCQSIMQGYYRDPESTAEAFAGEWYRTGDLARIDDDGYLFITDRLKDMIITGGENVYSREVEDALASIEGIQEAAVVGQPHTEWGETVVAYVVTDEGAELTAEAITEECRNRIAGYKAPREVHFTDALPRTPTGKVMKYKLRA
ncbi:AMP-binding protein [Aquisalimonas lutea]|uniref:class I adenylate-forming enzyme family protein n=1 Tax=Aquisalimonas lutea TaxID=1327750 RepID=UPI0025B60A4B|nr:AMP-binding protein [Aquisalimonas lutea]MDN3519133.1 AMP-binding protein [Aquisalimonas lutea]